MSNPKIIVVGISGVTCGGKTTTALELSKILPDSKRFSQDDYYFEVTDQRHTWIPELNHINFDILSSLDMEKMTKDIKEYIKNYKTYHKIKENVHKNKEFDSTEGMNGLDHTFHKELQNSDLRIKCHKEIKSSNIHLVIVEGFCILNYPPLVEIIDLKYFFTLEKEVCYARRQKRVYEPPDCPGYFDLCVWPEHLKQLEEVQETVKNVTYFNESANNPVDVILNDILDLLKK